MGTKFSRRFSALLIAAALFSGRLAAQSGAASEVTDNSYFQNESNRFIQLISWETVQGAAYYIMELEFMEGGIYTFNRQVRTQDPYMEFALRPGQYRYRVTAYDRGQNPGEASVWQPFAVRPANWPRIDSVSPDPVPLRERSATFTLNLRGENLPTDAGSTLTPVLTEKKSALQRAEGTAAVPARSYTAKNDGKSAAAVFASAGIPPGIYTLRLEGAGGLYVEYPGVRVGLSESSGDSGGSVDTETVFAPSTGFIFFIGWTPFIPFQGVINESYKATFHPAGFTIRAETFEVHPSEDIGIGVQISENYLYSKRPSYVLNAQVFTFHGRLIGRKRFFQDRFSVNLNIAGGPFLLYDNHRSYTTDGETRVVAESETLSGFSFSAGLGAQVRLSPHFLADFGAEYVHLFNSDSPQESYLRPGFGFAIQP